MTQTTAEPAEGQMRTVAEVCRQLKIGRTKFYDLVNKGELTPFDISGGPRKTPGPAPKGGRRRTIRVEQADVDAFKARGRATA
jgi:excisionase family DNA binding protein